MSAKMCNGFLFTPGLGPVWQVARGMSRFNGFPARGKPLKRFPASPDCDTGLKPGVNEMSQNATFN